jgi:hypothetical protein
LKGEKPSEIFYDKNFNFFVVLSNLSITFWNCYTGLLMAKVHLRGDDGFVKGMVSIGKLNKYQGLQADLIIGDDTGKLVILGLDDLETIKLNYDRTCDILNLGENGSTSVKCETLMKEDDILGVRASNWMGRSRILIIRKTGKK